MKFAKKSRETSPQENSVLGQDCDISNNYDDDDDAENTDNDVNTKELFGGKNYDGDLLEKFEEVKNNNEHKKFQTRMTLEIQKE